MQTSKNLMDQIEKITNVVKPDMKIFVGDSLAGNDTVNQAREFHKHTTFDCSILTKSDADARGGAALSIVKVTSTPVVYVGVGQEYQDLKAFDKELFLETVFGSKTEIPTPEAKPEPIEAEVKAESLEEVSQEPKTEEQKESQESKSSSETSTKSESVKADIPIIETPLDPISDDIKPHPTFINVSPTN